MGEKLRIWAFGCPHEPEDNEHGKFPVKRACRDAEEVGFDLGVFLGDYAGMKLPTPQVGEGYRKNLTNGLKNHWPEHIYPLAGNHDRTDEAGVETLSWFEQYMDPFCINPATSGNRYEFRPFPIHSGTVDGYEIKIGGISLFMMSDTARPLTPGRSNSDGDPGGVVQPATLAWWEQKLIDYRGTGQFVANFTHYGLRDTTAATGDYEGGVLKNSVYEGRYHGAGSTGGKNSSHLAFVGQDEGRPFIGHIENNPGDCHLSVHAHGHIMSGKSVGDKGHIVDKHGCLFVNNGALTEEHHGRAKEINPKSRFYEFENGSDKLLITAYMHKKVRDHRDRIIPKGVYSIKEFTLPFPVWF